jgi:putrescine transport system permease protein
MLGAWRVRLAEGWGKRSVIGVPYGFLILFFSLPFLVVLKISVSEVFGVHFGELLTFADGVATLKVDLSNYLFLLTDSLYVQTYGSSIRFAFLNTVICLVLGYPFAYFMARSPARYRPALLMLVSLPFWTSYLLRVYAWRGILEDHGVLNQFLLALHLIDAPKHMICPLHDPATVCDAREDGSEALGGCGRPRCQALAGILACDRAAV